ncbi:MAG: 2-C-methyl-D-erythritol 4-phosphate cytidylyltransferase [Bacteroidales bacterium]|nr:2-C-methyl-D-erythritol 4-phosphate cytidylyltransferase [Bacteroidales bacterium]
MKKAVIIAAGGHGIRMGLEKPKQFLIIHNKPLLVHTLEVFKKYDDSIDIVLVLPSQFMDYWNELIMKYPQNANCKIVVGGETRYHSVKNGLSMLTDQELIAVHDSVRPLIDGRFIEYLFNTARDKGSAIPVFPAIDTIREITDSGSRVLNRSNIFTVQTPQVFKREWLEQAYQQPYNNQITDDSMLVEMAGFKLTFVNGLKYNIKLTTPEDVIIIESLLQNQAKHV